MVVPVPEKVNLADKFSLFHAPYEPRIVGELNGQMVKLVKFQGPFVWHSHEVEDEMFVVVNGSFTMQFRGRDVEIREGEFIIVPHPDPPGKALTRWPGRSAAKCR